MSLCTHVHYIVLFVILDLMRMKISSVTCVVPVDTVGNAELYSGFIIICYVILLIYYIRYINHPRLIFTSASFSVLLQPEAIVCHYQ